MQYWKKWRSYSILCKLRFLATCYKYIPTFECQLQNSCNQCVLPCLSVVQVEWPHYCMMPPLDYFIRDYSKMNFVKYLGGVCMYSMYACIIVSLV